MRLSFTARLAVLSIFSAILWPAAAQETSRIEGLSQLDLGFMVQQRTLLQDLAASKLGRQFSGDRDRDLHLLQTLLDSGLVKPDQTQELQAMGIILGDLLAHDHDLHWVVLKDQAGRSRALRLKETDFLLFPVTMISRRRQAGNATPVSEIYRSASEIVRANKPASPGH